MKTAAAALSGTFNGRTYQIFSFKGKRYSYDGTTRGLEQQAIRRGAVAGDLVTTHVLGDRTYRLEFNKHIEHNALQVQALRVFV